MPTLILFPSTTPTLDADVAAMAQLKARYGAPMFCFGPHASTDAAAIDAARARRWTACSSASRRTRSCSSPRWTSLDQLASSRA